MEKKRQWLILAMLGILCIVVPPFMGTYAVHVLILVMMWITMALGWDILGGKTGQISFGHAIFFGLGAYGGGLLFLHWNITPWWGMAAGPVLAIIVGIPIGLVCFRLRGPYFALAMLALNEIIAIVFTNLDTLTNGATGIDCARTWGAEKLPYYYIALVIAAFAIFVTYRIQNSKYGYYFVSIREDQDAAEALGIPTTRYKIYAMIPSAGITGLAGALYMNYISSIYPETVFALEAISIFMILAVLIGGAGSLWGPVLGGAIFAGLDEILRATIGPISFLVFAVIAVLIIMFMPDGIIGSWPKVRAYLRRRKLTTGSEG